jgi:hypothetical protein
MLLRLRYTGAKFEKGIYIVADATNSVVGIVFDY